MLQRGSVRALIGVAVVSALSLTCGDGAGPDPNAVALVIISPDTGSMDTGDSLQLTAVARNADGATLSGKNFTWSTLDPTLVTVTAGGRVHARWPGNARIVATSEHRADTARVRVAARIDSLVLTPVLDTLRSLFQHRTLTVTAYIGGQVYEGGEYTWERSDTAFLLLVPSAPPSRTVTVVSRNNGSTVVRVREARGATDSARIVVRQRVVRVFAFAPPSRAYRACPLPANVVPLDANGSIVSDVGLQWRSSDTTLARVDSMGMITPLAVGLDTLSVTADTSSYRFTIDIQVAPVMPLTVSGVNNEPTATVGRTQYAIGQGKIGGEVAIAPARYRIVSSDTAIAAVVPGDTTVRRTFPFFSEPMRIVGRGLGEVTLSPYLCDVPGPPVTLTVTRPHLRLSGTLPANARTDDAPGFMFVFTQDSAGVRHYPAEPLTVRVTTTDTTVMRADSSQRHLGIGNAAFLTTVSYLEPGSVQLVVSDSAGVYVPDSSTVVQVAYPPLLFVGVGDTLHMGMRQHAFPAWDPRYVGVDRTVPPPALLVSLSTSDSMVARIAPESVSLLGPNNADTIEITSGDVRGVATLTAHANRHTDARTVVVVGRPAVLTLPPGGIIYPGDSSYFQVVTGDSASGVARIPAETVTFSVSSSDTAVLAVDSATLTVSAGGATSGTARISFRKAGTATITIADPRIAPYSYATGVNTITVTAPYLEVTSELPLGVEQTFGVGVGINGPFPPGQVVRVTHSNPAVATLADTIAPLFIPGFAIVAATGVSAGVDTVIASTPGFQSDTGVIIVGTGTIEVAQWPAFGLQVGESWPLELKILGPNGEIRNTAVTKTFTLTANGNIEFLKDGLPITSVTVDEGQHFTQFSVKGKAAGTGTVTVSATNYTPVTKSVTVAP